MAAMQHPTAPDLAADGARPAPLVLLAGNGCERAQDLLLEAHYRVRHAGSPAALWRLARSEAPGLIVLGDTVAEEPGLSLLSRLQDDTATRPIPVLMMAEAGDEELAVALGAADCLSLPLRPLVVLARVHAQLKLAALSARQEARA